MHRAVPNDGPGALGGARGAQVCAPERPCPPWEEWRGREGEKEREGGRERGREGEKESEKTRGTEGRGEGRMEERMEGGGRDGPSEIYRKGISPSHLQCRARGRQPAPHGCTQQSCIRCDADSMNPPGGQVHPRACPHCVEAPPADWDQRRQPSAETPDHLLSRTRSSSFSVLSSAGQVGRLSRH